MAMIMSSAAQQAARAMLLDSIRQEMARGNVSTTSEMIGYLLNGLRIAEKYHTADVSAIKRHVAAPELLSGLVSDKKVPHALLLRLADQRAHIQVHGGGAHAQRFKGSAQALQQRLVDQRVNQHA